MPARNNRDSGRLVVGLILLALGVLFLAGQLTGVNLGRLTWPLVIIIPGLAFFVGMVLGGKETGPLAIPGSIITTIGLILFYQNATNHWESWAYAWALIPSAVGVGMIIAGAWGGQPGMRREGLRLVTLGLVMFVIGLGFFELVIGISGRHGPLLTYGAPAALILLGLLLVLFRVPGRGEDGPPDAPRGEPGPSEGE